MQFRQRGQWSGIRINYCRPKYCQLKLNNRPRRPWTTRVNPADTRAARVHRPEGQLTPAVRVRWTVLKTPIKTRMFCTQSAVIKDRPSSLNTGTSHAAGLVYAVQFLGRIDRQIKIECIPRMLPNFRKSEDGTRACLIVYNYVCGGCLMLPSDVLCLHIYAILF
jgi:hypothetical protein